MGPILTEEAAFNMGNGKAYFFHLVCMDRGGPTQE
jgi:hypothetical protein